jgi:hypothetical protein
MVPAAEQALPAQQGWPTAEPQAAHFPCWQMALPAQSRPQQT